MPGWVFLIIGLFLGMSVGYAIHGWQRREIQQTYVPLPQFSVPVVRIYDPAEHPEPVVCSVATNHLMNIELTPGEPYYVIPTAGHPDGTWTVLCADCVVIPEGAL